MKIYNQQHVVARSEAEGRATKQSPSFKEIASPHFVRLAKTYLIFFFILTTLFCSVCFAAQSAEITGYSYKHNFTAGETVTFNVNIKNTGDAISAPQYIYVQVILTNSATGAEIYPAGATASTSLATGATFTSTTSWTTVAGQYTVTLVVYASPDGAIETELTRKYGAFPLRAGTGPTAEKLKVFPTTIDFGIIPYGRHMHPLPLEINWDFFLYNTMREQEPWYMRIYTDNSTKYKSIEDAVYAGSPAGLVSSNGKYTIPLRVWYLNNPPEHQEMGWDSNLSGPPPVDDDTYWKGSMLDTGERFENKAAWLRIPDYSEMTADRGTWRNLIGQDITDTQYVTDITPTGDFTLKSPFSVYFATDGNPTSVKGNYSTDLIIEIYSP